MMCITSDTMKPIFIALLCLAMLADIAVGNAIDMMQERAIQDTNMMKSVISAERNAHLVRRSAQPTFRMFPSGMNTGGMGEGMEQTGGGVGGRFGFGFGINAGGEAGMGGGRKK